MKKPAIPFAFEAAALLAASSPPSWYVHAHRSVALAAEGNFKGEGYILCDKQGKKNEQRIEGGYPGCGAWYQNAARN
ncbi:hypothetical protein [Candidatus Regiella insecticola]|uniref:hypothetical protein n=1 Tax=Candidatus Regiella insecticola TaxID=138073 RepID=UPI0002EF1E53|nr:hypothetical protein [Candidatus Regiella insecticola]